MPTRQVELGRELFHFTSKRHWINKAAGWCALYESSELVFLDERGRMLRWGDDFDRAERDGAYPVRVYLAQLDA